MPTGLPLTFDFYDDLGESRTRFRSMIAAVRTQADRPENNQLTVMRLSDLARIKVETEDDILGDELQPDKEDDEDDSDSDEMSLDLLYGALLNQALWWSQPDPCYAEFKYNRYLESAGTVNLFNVESIMQRFSMREGKRVGNVISHRSHTSVTRNTKRKDMLSTGL
jgi:ribosome assembly protein RRB1